jgi:Uma2 family endonuclease
MKHLLDVPRTAMEIFNMLPKGTLCEVIDNILYMLPSPTFFHQELLTNLATDLNHYIKSNKLGRVIVAPCDVYLDNEQNVVQPDILFVKSNSSISLQKKGIIGAPDLVFESLSTNKVHDQKRKLEVYQRNSVPKYIIIDPETKEVWHYLLHEQEYVLQPSPEKGKVWISQLSLEIAI